MLAKVIRIRDKVEEILVVILLALAFYLTFQEVILRYFFNTGWSGSYEITVMSLIYCTFIGASLGVRENVHIGVDLLVKKFPLKAQKIFVFITIILCIFFGAIIGIKGYQFAGFIHRSHLLSRDLRIPMEIGYAAVPLGGALFSLRFIERLAAFLKGGTFETDRMHELSEEKYGLASANQLFLFPLNHLEFYSN